MVHSFLPHSQVSGLCFCTACSSHRPVRLLYSIQCRLCVQCTLQIIFTVYSTDYLYSVHCRLFVQCTVQIIFSVQYRFFLQCTGPIICTVYSTGLFVQCTVQIIFQVCSTDRIQFCKYILFLMFYNLIYSESLHLAPSTLVITTDRYSRT